MPVTIDLETGNLVTNDLLTFERTMAKAIGEYNKLKINRILVHIQYFMKNEDITHLLIDSVSVSSNRLEFEFVKFDIHGEHILHMSFNNDDYRLTDFIEIKSLIKCP
jgi:hypothetical protein